MSAIGANVVASNDDWYGPELYVFGQPTLRPCLNSGKPYKASTREFLWEESEKLVGQNFVFYSSLVEKDELKLEPEMKEVRDEIVDVEEVVEADVAEEATEGGVDDVVVQPEQEVEAEAE
jgi:hypothetical protein